MNASSFSDNVTLNVSDSQHVTLSELLPGTMYNITIRAYQDILGPPSDVLITATFDGK